MDAVITTAPAPTAGTPRLDLDRIVVARAKAEFDEMPGLRLTPDQAARLWNLNLAQAEFLLTLLVANGVLVRNRSGAYRRRGCTRCE
jgi:hypothetical protein